MINGNSNCRNFCQWRRRASAKREAASALGVEPNRCLAVEDARNGAAAAVAAGMRVVVVSRDGSMMAPYATVSSVDASEMRSWMGLG